jgi:protease-4
LNGYYVASAADCIVIDPEGMLALEGFAIGKTYLKGLLDKVGIGVEEMRYFKYKSAAEALARGEMSEADRDQLRAYLEDCYALVRKDIALARRFNELKFDSLVDGKMVFSPVEALHEGLVDTLGRWSDAENIVAKIEKGKKPFIGPGRLAKNLFPPDYWGVDPKIAVVYAVGVCDLETGIQARRLERILRGLEKDGSVKAVVLRADSPGGSALASDLVSEALASCKKAKPVIVSQGNVAGSGGYWISMNGDTIVSGPTTITGSIGVIAMWLWNRDLGDKWGMHTDIVQAGRHADLATGMTLPLIGFRIPNRELTLEEKSRIESLIRGMYGQFVAKVASGRGLKTEDIYPVAEGRIWSGLAARQRRLVDLIGGLDDAVRLAREKAHIAPDRNVEVVEFPEKGLFNPDVFMPKLFGVHPAVEKTNPRMDLWKLITDYPGKPLPLLPPDLYF